MFVIPLNFWGVLIANATTYFLSLREPPSLITKSCGSAGIDKNEEHTSICYSRVSGNNTNLIIHVFRLSCDVVCPYKVRNIWG